MNEELRARELVRYVLLNPLLSIERRGLLLCRSDFDIGDKAIKKDEFFLTLAADPLTALPVLESPPC